MKYSIIFLISLLIISCTPSEKEEAAINADEKTPVVLASDKVQLNQEQIDLAEIEIGQISHQIMSDFVECSGTITLPPQHIMTITPPMAGFVERVNFLPGNFVRKGSLLAVLSHQDYISLQQNYLETASSFGFAEQEYERQKTLAEGNAAARKKLEETTAQYQTLKAQLMGLAARLRYIGINPENLAEQGISSSISIYAPADAYVTEVKANPGKFVSEQDELYELIDKTHLHLDLNVFEKDISKIEEGQKVFFSLNENRQRIYEGEVLLVGQKLEPESRAFSVHVDLSEPEPAFRPGMYTQARIFLHSDSVAAVPEAALIQENNHQYLFVKQGDDFVRKEVKTGASVNEMVEILNPETIEEYPLVIKGAYYLEAALED
jgi:cobalt-zinc-cadmium efflux system membrane fusion protein